MEKYELSLWRVQHEFGSIGLFDIIVVTIMARIESKITGKYVDKLVVFVIQTTHNL
jgi:hypothetical protein